MKIVIGKTIIRDKDLLQWASRDSRQMEEEWIRSFAATIVDWFDHSETIKIGTSGSTGIPKIIEIEKTAMRESAHKTANRFGLSRAMTTLNCLPARYIAGKMMLIRALVLDLDQVVIEPKLKLSYEYEGPIHFAALTPMQLEATLDSRPDLISPIQTIIIGGGPVMRSLRDRIQNIRPRCFATYGMTETITHIAISRLNGPEATETFGALGGVWFEVQNGNLVIHADHLKSSPIHTTDLVALCDQHHFKWLGRSDNIINSGGVKINPETIESLLDNHITDRFIVTAEPDDLSGQKVVLIIEASPYQQEMLDNINAIILSLPKLKRPGKIYFVPCFLETPTGKIQRQFDLYFPSST